MFFDHFQNTFPDRFFGTGSTVTSSTRRRLPGTAASTSGLLALALKQSRTVTVLHTLLLLQLFTTGYFSKLESTKEDSRKCIIFLCKPHTRLVLASTAKTQLASASVRPARFIYYPNDDEVTSCLGKQMVATNTDIQSGGAESTQPPPPNL